MLGEVVVGGRLTEKVKEKAMLYLVNEYPW
jgi:hypothetical protein